MKKKFLSGALVGGLVVGLVKTKKARQLAIKGLAKGISIKDEAQATLATIKEEAEVLHEEAKLQVAQEKAEAEEKALAAEAPAAAEAGAGPEVPAAE